MEEIKTKKEKLRIDGFMLLMAILMPISGIIIYCIHCADSPEEAKTVGVASLVAWVVWTFVSIVVFGRLLGLF